MDSATLSTPMLGEKFKFSPLVRILTVHLSLERCFRLGLGARWILSGTGDHLYGERKREGLAVRGGNGYGHAAGRPCDFSDSYSQALKN
ncbi:MAG: hypothetical protein Ct9H300mP21_08880 [Pseudomonadota bacterium]|nr:MAG: hypothetical protein Ct9H300mP21_08880 [Pseudomonadota bacterium]